MYYKNNTSYYHIIEDCFIHIGTGTGKYTKNNGDTVKYVPKDNGDLRTNVALYTDRITYESPYASYQYYGIRGDGSHKVSNYTTAGTGTYWDKRMISVDMDRVVKQVQDYIGR